MHFSKTRAIILFGGLVAFAFALRLTLPAAEKWNGRMPAPPRADIFTPAHRSFAAAVEDFFSYHPTPVQPIAFTHKVHLANGMECANCHTNVEKGAIAGIPDIRLCMTCHQVVATDKPEIKKMAALFASGQDIQWQRVYNYSPTLHVKFNHAPHIRNGVECATCHGDMRQQTQAVRAVNINMGFCINCHKSRKVSAECATCHF
jgi:hypothetical protein